MKRARLHFLAGLADEPDDPLAQLGGGPIRERHREDSPRGNLLDTHEVRDPMGQHARLARARSRENQHGTVRRRHRAPLLGVQAAKDLLPPGVGDLGLVASLLSLRGRIEAGLRVHRVRSVAEPCRLGEGLRRNLGDLLEPGSLRLRGGIVRPVGGSPSRGGIHP